MYKAFYPVDDVLKGFTFKHPADESSTYKLFNRFASLKFKFNTTHIIHGFVGYFHSILYDTVELSIRPSDHTEGMASWFPLYFPIIVIYIIKFRNH